jgi:hypothetical protein
MAGVKGRSGRKSKQLRAKLGDLLDDAWPVANRHNLVRQLHALAMTGDTEAAKILLFMTYGRPRSQVEVSGPEGQPVELNVSIVDEFKRRIANLARARGSE